MNANKAGVTFYENTATTRWLLPHPALLYGSVGINAIFTTLLSRKLGQSRHQWIRKLQYVPQVDAMGWNIAGVTSTYHNWHPAKR